jgi:hypothetical protein
MEDNRNQEPAPLDAGAPMKPVMTCHVEDSIGQNVKQTGPQWQGVRAGNRPDELIIPSEEDTLTHWVCSLDGMCLEQQRTRGFFMSAD